MKMLAGFLLGLLLLEALSGCASAQEGKPTAQAGCIISMRSWCMVVGWDTNMQDAGDQRMWSIYVDNNQRDNPLTIAEDKTCSSLYALPNPRKISDEITDYGPRKRRRLVVSLFDGCKLELQYLLPASGVDEGFARAVKFGILADGRPLQEFGS